MANENEIVVSRVLDAPPSRVFAAWQKPEIVKAWWGAKGDTIPFCEIDFRVGGVFQYLIQSSDGMEFRCKGFYREIVENERLVFTDAFVDEHGEPTQIEGMENWPRETLITVTFENLQNKTRMTVRQKPISPTSIESAAFAIASEGATEFWTGTLDKLADFVVAN